jgi:nitroreductase
MEFPVIDLIRNRRSIRAYDPRPVEQEKIFSLFEAARWAASGSNEQPWMFIYAIKGQPLWEKLFHLLNDSNRIWAIQAPVLILSLSRKSFIRNGKPNGYARHDLGASLAFLSLQAVSVGLQAHPMGGYDAIKAITDLNIPENVEPGAMIAVGYPGNPEDLPEILRQKENKPRERYLQEEFVFNSEF